MRALCGLPLLLIAACGFRPGGEDNGTEADAAIDSAETDADLGDGGDVDGATIDAATTDAATTDAATTDAATIDAAAIDAATIDAAAIDARLIDAAMIDARPACPAVYDVTFNGSRYRLVAGPATVGPASTDCNDDLPGGRTHLATFEVAADMDGAIDAVNPGNSAEPLVGAACSSVDCSSMALWSWVTGTMVAATLWETGQPNNGFTQKIAAARQVSSTWTLNNVDAATATRPYICECDP